MEKFTKEISKITLKMDKDMKLIKLVMNTKEILNNLLKMDKEN
jgi:hypothetical protein